MILLLSILYGVYLELLVHNLVSITPTAAGAGQGGATVSVRPLFTSRNGGQVAATLLLFLVDWICFLFIFPPSAAFTLRLRDAWLFVPYVVALSALGFAVVFALEDPMRSCRPLGVYHGAAAIAEGMWLYFSFKTVGGVIALSEVADVGGVIVVYVLARLILGFVSWQLPREPRRRVQPEVLTFVALLLKPGLLVVVSNLPSAQCILEVVR